MHRLPGIILRYFAGANSIVGRMRASLRIVAVVLLIPALASLVMMLVYSQRYAGILAKMETVAELKPVVNESIPDEVWSVVAGRKEFAEGEFYDSMTQVNHRLEQLSAGATGNNRLQLVVARRTMDTLKNYIDRLGEQIYRAAPVVDNEALLEEVRDVSALVNDMLEDYITVEISSATLTSRRLNAIVLSTALLEAALLLLALAFIMVAQRATARSIRRPIEQLEHFSGLLAGGDLSARVPTTSLEELRNLTDSFNVMADRLGRQVEQNRREQENLKKSELRALQAQVTPHFLYNTLDAIVWLAEAGKGEEVVRITRAISDFFRISLSQGRDWIPIEQEIVHMGGYLTIQKVRYRDILDYSIDIPPEARIGMMPKLLLQPLAENAIYHGIKYRRGGGRINICGRRIGDCISFSVTDNGPGMSAERLLAVRAMMENLDTTQEESGGYGLYNVNQRLQLYYNRESCLTIESDANGTKVSFTVPLRSETDV